MRFRHNREREAEVTHLISYRYQSVVSLKDKIFKFLLTEERSSTLIHGVREGDRLMEQSDRSLGQPTSKTNFGYIRSTSGELEKQNLLMLAK